MPKIKFEEIEAMLSKGRLFPVYLICGEEHYLTRVVVDKVKDVYKAETGAEMERLSAKGLDTVAALDGLKTLPMWTKGKLLIVDEAQSLTQASKELILNYVKSPSPTAILVLVASKFDGRSKLCKSIAENGAVVEISTIYENRMAYWINRECREKGYNISHEAAEFMTELVGTDLSKMSGAVEKIILYIGKKKLIDLQDVETVLSDTSQKSIFDLTNAVGSKKIAIFISGPNFDKISLKEYFKNNLPSYMISEKIIHLDKLPLSNNAKIDKNALLNYLYFL